MGGVVLWREVWRWLVELEEDRLYGWDGINLS